MPLETAGTGVGEPAGGELQPHTAIACYSRYLCTQAGDSNDNNLLAEHRGELLQPLLEVLKVGVGHDKFVETRRLLTRAVEVVVVVAAARAEAEARADADDVLLVWLEQTRLGSSTANMRYGSQKLCRATQRFVMRFFEIDETLIKQS